jgi:hypothetical protein
MSAIEVTVYFHAFRNILLVPTLKWWDDSVWYCVLFDNKKRVPLMCLLSYLKLLNRLNILHYYILHCLVHGWQQQLIVCAVLHVQMHKHPTYARGVARYIYYILLHSCCTHQTFAILLAQLLGAGWLAFHVYHAALLGCHCKNARFCGRGLPILAALLLIYVFGARDYSAMHT